MNRLDSEPVDEIITVKKMRRVRDADEPIRSSPPARPRPPAWVLAAFSGLVLSLATGAGGYTLGKSAGKATPAAERAPANAVANPPAAPAPFAGVPVPPVQEAKLSRGDVNLWLYAGMASNPDGTPKGEMLRTVADVQKKYGRPATAKMLPSARRTYDTRGDFVYIYHHLTVEAQHSGAVDATTTFHFHGGSPTDVATGVAFTP